ncbi:class II aldolase/adducin family protein [Nocardia rhizosphaerihabitans]|uniref:class II aldolase/adducin family protein n=1 Tax=Nocardia rhizosphaerihabitans TaxID=1691570 RepID=UPI00366A6F32
MTDPRTHVVQASHVLAVAGLGDMVWGHASVRDPDGRGVWMKAAGWGFEEIDDDKVVLVSAAGEVLDGSGRRHLEYPIHTEIMAARPDVGCVVHTHAPTLSAFASLNCELRPISHDGVLFANSRLPRFTETGALIDSPRLGTALASTLGSADAILIPHHGAVTVGPDVATAVMGAVLLERACRTQLMSMSAGGPKTWSNESEVDFKRGQVWDPTQVLAGWNYLLRRAQDNSDAVSPVGIERGAL